MSIKCDTCNTIKSNWDNTKFWLTLTGLLHKEVAWLDVTTYRNRWVNHSYQKEQSMSKLTYVEVAKLCHSVNKAYCESLGDLTQQVWDEAPEWQKQSAIRGVEFHFVNKNATPEDSHDSWMKQKASEGWKFGPVKNAEAKEHPCFLPYKELPVNQRAKDYVFKAICDFFKSEYFS